MSEKRIAFFQYDMQVGGIQHSLYALLSRIKEDKDICADVFINHPADVFYDLGKLEDTGNIRIFFTRPLPYYNRLMNFENAKALYMDQIKADIFDALNGGPMDYDLALDFNSYQNDCALGTLAVNASMRICWIHNDVQKKLAQEKKYAVLHHFFKEKYGLYDVFAAVSEGVILPFRKVNPGAKENNIICRNMLDEMLFKEALSLPSPYTDVKKRNVVWVGCLNHQKGTDILCDVIRTACVDDAGKDLHFTVIGTGPEHKKMWSFIEKHSLADKVSLKGTLKNPLPYILNADVYLSTSRYEGQGISMHEAAALGTPVLLPTHLSPYIETEGKFFCSDDGEMEPIFRFTDKLAEGVLATPKRESVIDPFEIREKVYGYNNAAYGQFLSLLELA